MHDEGYAWTPETLGLGKVSWEIGSFEFGKCSRNFLGSLLTLQGLIGMGLDQAWFCVACFVLNMLCDLCGDGVIVSQIA